MTKIPEKFPQLQLHLAKAPLLNFTAVYVILETPANTPPPRVYGAYLRGRNSQFEKPCLKIPFGRYCRRWGDNIEVDHDESGFGFNRPRAWSSDGLFKHGNNSKKVKLSLHAEKRKFLTLPGLELRTLSRPARS
jgi:hypothetical protein